MYRVTVTQIATVQTLFSFGYMPVQTEEIVYMQEYAESEAVRAVGDYIDRVNENAKDYVTLEWIA